MRDKKAEPLLVSHFAYKECEMKILGVFSFSFKVFLYQFYQSSG